MKARKTESVRQFFAEARIPLDDSHLAEMANGGFQHDVVVRILTSEYNMAKMSVQEFAKRLDAIKDESPTVVAQPTSVSNPEAVRKTNNERGGRKSGKLFVKAISSLAFSLLVVLISQRLSSLESNMDSLKEKMEQKAGKAELETQAQKVEKVLSKQGNLLDKMTENIDSKLSRLTAELDGKVEQSEYNLRLSKIDSRITAKETALTRLAAKLAATEKRLDVGVGVGVESGKSLTKPNMTGSVRSSFPFSLPPPSDGETANRWIDAFSMKEHSNPPVLPEKYRKQ